jgi:hypothetical protein
MTVKTDTIGMNIIALELCNDNSKLLTKLFFRYTPEDFQINFTKK